MWSVIDVSIQWVDHLRQPKWTCYQTNEVLTTQQHSLALFSPAMYEHENKMVLYSMNKWDVNGKHAMNQLIKWNILLKWALNMWIEIDANIFSTFTTIELAPNMFSNHQKNNAKEPICNDSINKIRFMLFLITVYLSSKSNLFLYK